MNDLELTESNPPGIIGVVQWGMPIFGSEKEGPSQDLFFQYSELIVAYLRYLGL